LMVSSGYNAASTAHPATAPLAMCPASSRADIIDDVALEPLEPLDGDGDARAASVVRSLIARGRVTSSGGDRHSRTREHTTTTTTTTRACRGDDVVIAVTVVADAARMRRRYVTRSDDDDDS
jgi:hypothetical protein